MTLRTTLGNKLIAYGRKVGYKEGESELSVELSDHSIDVKMVETSVDNRAWDENLYSRGNVFLNGYANPIKPTVEYNKELENPDTVDVNEGSTDDEQGGTTDYDGHVELISSPRYRDYMNQDLISQLLNPREQWRLIAYAIIGLGAVMLIDLVVSLAAAGVF